MISTGTKPYFIVSIFPSDPHMKIFFQERFIKDLFDHSGRNIIVNWLIRSFVEHKRNLKLCVLKAKNKEILFDIFSFDKYSRDFHLYTCY